MSSLLFSVIYRCHNYTENCVYRVLLRRGYHYSTMVSWACFVRAWSWHRWHSARKFHTFVTWPGKSSSVCVRVYISAYAPCLTCRSCLPLSQVNGTQRKKVSICTHNGYWIRAKISFPSRNVARLSVMETSCSSDGKARKIGIGLREN